MPSRKKTIAEPSIHVLHVELVDIQPAIWRELHVRSDMPLSKLHDVLQESFGWAHCHMHVFEDTSRHEDMLEWLGGSFDPEAFDLKAADRAVRAVK
ncbi:IS1096 element passenger TnpR family protein [Myxococcus sp. 1LA]